MGDTAIIRTGLRLLNLGEESLAWQALRCRSEDSIFLQEAKREGFSKQESKARTKHGKDPQDQWVDKLEKACHRNNISIVAQSSVKNKVKDFLSTYSPINKEIIRKLEDKGLGKIEDICSEGKINGRILKEKGVRLSKAERVKLNGLCKEFKLKKADNPIVITQPLGSVERMSMDSFSYKKGNSVYSWTDGSAVKEQAGWGVWFNHIPRINMKGRNIGTDNVGEAELEAIEQGLRIIPRGSSVVFFVDSMYAAESINSASKYGEAWLKERVNRFTLRRIVKLMENMEEEWNCQVRFEHVYSHIQEKLDKARKEDNKKLIERIEKWMEKTKWRFGGWEWIADGNEKADRLANEGRTMPKPHILIPEGIDKFTVCLKEAGNERATDTKVADIIKDKFQAKWTGKRAKRIPAYDWCHEKITEGPEGPISRRFTPN